MKLVRLVDLKIEKEQNFLYSGHEISDTHAVIHPHTQTLTYSQTPEHL